MGILTTVCAWCPDGQVTLLNQQIVAGESGVLLGMCGACEAVQIAANVESEARASWRGRRSSLEEAQAQPWKSYSKRLEEAKAVEQDFAEMDQRPYPGGGAILWSGIGLVAWSAIVWWWWVGAAPLFAALRWLR